MKMLRTRNNSRQVFSRLCLPAVLLAMCCLPIGSVVKAGDTSPIVLGSSHRILDVADTPLEVFLYKPAGYDGKRVIMVMHGVKRNADDYRDHAREMGDRFNALIVAPKFDKERFPSRRYQRGGIFNQDKKVAPEQEWTYQFIPPLAAAIRKIEQLPELPYWIIGHSAGGQFVARMAAFIETGAERLVAANPGSHLFPSRELPFGYGFGGLPNELANDERLQRYLAAPLTLYLGTADNKADRYFDQSEPALKQGEGRWQRGHAVFQLANKIAEENSWPCNWRLVEAEGVPHSHQEMFTHQKCADALFGEAVNRTDAAGWNNPTDQWKTNGPRRGSLFIAGGAAVDATYQYFLEMVGCPDAPIEIATCFSSLNLASQRVSEAMRWDAARSGERASAACPRRASQGCGRRLHSKRAGKSAPAMPTRKLTEVTRTGIGSSNSPILNLPIPASY